MKNILGQDGLVYRVLTKTVDLIILNILFCVSCIPIFTIGTACTALYSVTLKMCKNEESYNVRSYVQYFKQNFKKATVVWGLCALVLLLFYMDFSILASMKSEMGVVLTTAVLAAGLFVAMVLSYVFPLMAKFENTLPNIFKNALIISMTRILYTIPVTAVNLLFVFAMFAGGTPTVYGVPVYVIIGFALTAYVNSFLLGKVFERYV